MFTDPQMLLASVLLLVAMLGFALPVHEFAHAWVANRLGDGTARLFGRLTLDPRAHFDQVGGLMLIISVLFLRFGFGWAKPTPVNPMNLRGRQWGEAMVAAAGPVSNLILAIAGAIPLRYILATGIDAGILTNFLALFVEINLILMLFNFIPIPPLDGSKVLFAFLDPRTAYQVRPVLEQYGFLILFAALLLPIFGGQTLIGIVFSTFLDPLFSLLVGQPL